MSVTIGGLRVQSVVMPFGNPQSWTLVDREAATVEPVESFLAHLHAVERSPNTVKAYAHDLRDWFEFLDQRGLAWSGVRLEDVGRFVAWLRLPATARAGNVTALPSAASVCSEATVNRKLSAIAAFYEFHQRHGVDLGDLLTTWRRRGTHGGSWRPLLAHLGSRPERSRRVRLRAERRIPDTLDDEQVETIVAACDRLRDRFLLVLLASSGLRVGEALGLRHSDIDPAARLVSVVPRTSANRARAKGGGRQVPVSAKVIRFYADYLHGEYGELDSDYVFVNLWSGPIGHPLTYPSVYDLVCRLRERTGIMFGPHTFRHTYATELLRRGVAVEVVQHLLGHASIATTSDAYAHLKVEGRAASPGGGGVADRPGWVAVSVEPLAAAHAASLAERLDAVVRAEFRVDVLVPAIGDPILGSPACAVSGCMRSSRYGGLCPAHLTRWKKAGRPDRQAWAATADPAVTGHRPLQSCLVTGCEFGQHRYQLCYKHSRAWDKAGRPMIERWKPELVVAPVAVCTVPGCALWAELDAGWCHSHHTRWRQHGCPPAAEFTAYCTSYGEDRFDLRALLPQLRLEVQYALQCRVDANRTRTTPRSIKPLLDHLVASGARSLLERLLADWVAGLPAAAATRTPRAFLGYAVECLLDLREGVGWDSEYQRDVWLLRRIGIAGHDRARLDFTVVQPLWLRELAKRWCRWRLSCGVGLQRVRSDRIALVRLSRLTPGLADSTGPTVLDRAALEAYLARLAVELPHAKTRSSDIGSVTGFLHAVRQHRWASLPAEAQLYPSDHPRRAESPAPRAIPEFVMGQLEDATNLDRITDPRIRLLMEVLIRTGLRIGDATRLGLDCLVRDPQGAVYLRYRNHKMRRDAVVPIDDELTAMIEAQQARTRIRFPSTGVLLPRSTANPDGRLPIPTATFHRQLGIWLETCGVTDELGRPVHVTAHQFRHTAATRWINHDVPQEVVRRLLNHSSHTMTAVYARLADTTIREQWERAQKINIRGEPVDTSIDGPLADAEWMKHNLARAKLALPNGYCGLPLQKSCPHANSCLTCPLFVTTAEFLPQHHRQLDDTRALIARAQSDGHARLAEMNRTVETNLLTIITALERGHRCSNGNGETCCGEGASDATS